MRYHSPIPVPARAARRMAFGALVTLAALAAIALGLTVAPAEASPGAACPGGPVTGQHIYDCAGLLTASETSDLEARARAVQDAGAPVVVYLQAKDASYDQTLSDAANLMARWNVESRPGAKDGVVMLLNLKPGDLRHGQVALYAGQTLFNGALPHSELNRIYQDVMLPQLASGKSAAGIGAGLDALATDLRAGGPPAPTPPPGQDVARVLGPVPYNALAGLLALIALGMGLASERRVRDASPRLTTTPTGAPPANLAPAVAGALITGKISGQQMEATILDFARRGLLSIEPLDHGKASIQLLGDGSGLTGYENALWQALASQAGMDGIIPRERMYQVAAGWRPAASALRDELVARGWLDRDVMKKRRPLISVLIICAIMLPLGLTLIGLAQQGWPIIGGLLSIAGGSAALAFLMCIPTVTPEGQRAAQPARDYLAGVGAQTPDIDANMALPYLIATGQANTYTRWLQAATARPGSGYIALYPYWIVLHSSMAPPAGSGAGMVVGASGAAAGGGGAGGAF